MSKNLLLPFIGLVIGLLKSDLIENLLQIKNRGFRF